VYNETKCLESLKSEENIKYCAIILKICDSCGRKFQFHFVYYAIVVQQQFLNDRQENYDQDYAYAAFFLDQILRLCAPNSNRCIKIVKKICEILSEVDKQLHSQIKEKLLMKSSSEKSDQESRNFDGGKSAIVESPEIYLNTWISS
ncbi:uncharacterized protein NPIL_252261, partial [Nephila pilipes]